MSYEFIKLSEVEKVDTSHNANLLIEEYGEIKRLSTENINFGGSGNQVQADWNETDDTSPAYIANKPNVSGSVTFEVATGSILSANGSNHTVQQVKDIWNSGANVRYKQYNSNLGANIETTVLSMNFGETSGSAYGTLWFLNTNSGDIENFNFY